MRKLPKHNVILRLFLAILRETQKSTKKAEQAAFFKEAARQTALEIKLVWKYHFGLRMICGKETVEDVIVDEAMKLIIMDNKIESKVLLEKTRKRKDRCEKDFFKQKVATFQTDKLDMPMNISK